MIKKITFVFTLLGLFAAFQNFSKVDASKISNKDNVKENSFDQTAKINMRGRRGNCCGDVK